MFCTVFGVEEIKLALICSESSSMGTNTREIQCPTPCLINDSTDMLFNFKYLEVSIVLSLSLSVSAKMFHVFGQKMLILAFPRNVRMRLRLSFV